VCRRKKSLCLEMEGFVSFSLCVHVCLTQMIIVTGTGSKYFSRALEKLDSRNYPSSLK
ncbi:Hypothetical protein FKW44_001519, partial [Caligus rogercresseyi]